MAQIETPSGKGAADENFPVGSWLIPRALRPHVASYYAFARAIDDIADNPALTAADKIARLRDLVEQRAGGDSARRDGQQRQPRGEPCPSDVLR